MKTHLEHFDLSRRYNRFVRQIVRHDTVWTLQDDDDFFAECPSLHEEDALGEPRMVWWRVIFALVIVQITAFIVSFFKEDSIINPEFKSYCRSHKHNSNLPELFSSSRNEFWQLFTMLVIGASIAAATQVFVPRFIINAVGSDIILSVAAMIGLSFIVSICSSIDAFFALAYARSFTTGSILSFLLAGPMVDIKLIMLMKTTFRWRFIVAIVLIIFALSFAAGIGVNLYAR